MSMSGVRNTIFDVLPRAACVSWMRSLSSRVAIAESSSTIQERKKVETSKSPYVLTASWRMLRSGGLPSQNSSPCTGFLKSQVLKSMPTPIENVLRANPLYALRLELVGLHLRGKELDAPANPAELVRGHLGPGAAGAMPKSQERR